MLKILFAGSNDAAPARSEPLPLFPSSPLHDLETHDPRRRAFAKPAAWLHPPAFNLNPAVTQSMRAGLAGALERIEANVPEKAGVQFVADVEPGKLRVVAGGVAQ